MGGNYFSGETPPLKRLCLVAQPRLQESKKRISGEGCKRRRFHVLRGKGERLGHEAGTHALKHSRVAYNRKPHGHWRNSLK